MSLAAYVWAKDLPLDLVGATPYRVLLKYADRVDENGRAAWYNVEELAAFFKCSTRTIQRAIRELLDADLIREGDQRFVQHLRGGNRPTVYDLNMRPNLALALDLGVTTSVTPDALRGDNPGPRGVTTVVAHRTVIEPNKEITNVSTERGDKFVTPQNRPPFGVQPAPVIPRYVPEPPVERPAPRTTAEAEAVSDLESLKCPAAPRFHHWVPLGADECVRGCGTRLTIDQEIPA